MAVTSALMTVAEFSALPQPRGGVRQELHHGEVFELPPVKLVHSLTQKRLEDLIEAIVDKREFKVHEEFPFRPVLENEVWVADVAVYRKDSIARMRRDGYFEGVPLIVIEVLSPSNTASEMMDRETMCLRNGGLEFWLVDPERQSVKVIDSRGHSKIHDVNGVVESSVIGGSIAVRDIFDEIENPL